MIPFRNLRRFIRKAAEQPAYAARVALRRLQAYHAYRQPSGIASPPEAVTIFLTHKCNLRCKMCGQWGENGVTKTSTGEVLRQELSLDSLKALVNDLSAGGANITLFGGEPFIYGDIIALIRHIKSRGLHCLAITNGSLLRHLADDIVRAGLDELNISLDGSAATHDAIRGAEGLFQRIADGIREVAAAKQRQGAGKPLINLQCTINRDNYRLLDEMIAAGRELQVNSLTYHHLIFLTREIFERQRNRCAALFPGTVSPAWQGFIFEPEIDVPALIAKITEVRSLPADFFVNFYPNFSNDEIRDYYTNHAYLPRGYRPRCLSPWITAYVFPDGTVRPCLNVDYSFGNIQERPFREIWNSAAAIRYRTALRNDRLFPACVRCTELYRY